MTQEVRITLDANLYYRDKERIDPAAVSREWGYVLTKLIKDHAMADHKFVNVKVDIIPHDNDRDYTEEDARRHCGRTYLDVVREALPGCDSTRIKQMCPGWLIPGGPVFTDNGMGKCRYHPLTGVCGDCWMIDCPDNVSEEAQNHND